MRKIFLLHTLCFLLSAFLIGCATIPATSIKEGVIIDGTHYIRAESLCQVYNLDSYWDPISKKLILKKDDKQVKMLVDSRTALLDNQVWTMNKDFR